MHPTILSIGPFAIRSYGFMLALGFLAGILFTARRASKQGENPDHIYNLSIWLVLSSLIGARLYYVFTHYYEFRADEGTAFIRRIFVEFRNMFWPVGADGQIGISGLVLYGGLIMATLAMAFYLRRHRLSIPKYMDLMAPCIGLGEFFTRIGCFLNGCCFGHPTDSVLGMVFPRTCAAGFYYPDMHIHPAQLYNSLAGLLIFGLLIWLERWKKFDGFTAILFFLFYAVGRFIIDYTRHYEERMTFWGLSHNQVLSLVIIAVSTGLLVYFMKRSGGRIEPEPEAETDL